MRFHADETRLWVQGLEAKESALGLPTAASAEKPAVYVCGRGWVTGQNLITQIAQQG